MFIRIKIVAYINLQHEPYNKKYFMKEQIDELFVKVICIININKFENKYTYLKKFFTKRFKMFLDIFSSIKMTNQTYCFKRKM